MMELHIVFEEFGGFRGGGAARYPSFGFAESKKISVQDLCVVPPSVW